MLIFLNTITENTSNKLSSITSGIHQITYQTNGLGTRINQTVNGQVTNYTLDQETELTQVLEDDSNTYLYGLGRISQENAENIDYYLGDGLGSVRQVLLGDSARTVVLARDYASYGEVKTTSGTGTSAFGFTGEMQSGGLVHLRARDYATHAYISRLLSFVLLSN